MSLKLLEKSALNFAGPFFALSVLSQPLLLLCIFVHVDLNGGLDWTVVVSEQQEKPRQSNRISQI